MQESLPLLNQKSPHYNPSLALPFENKPLSFFRLINLLTSSVAQYKKFPIADQKKQPRSGEGKK